MLRTIRRVTTSLAACRVPQGGVRVCSSVSIPGHISEVRVDNLLAQVSPWNQSIIIDPYTYSVKVDQSIRERAADAFREDDADGFCEVAFEFLRDCGECSDLDIAIDRKVLFLDETSPIRAPLIDGWRLAFNAARCAESPRNGHSTNRSGLGFVGDRGIGKSQLIQFLAVVPSLLLDNVVGLYVDARDVKDELELYHMLHHALRRRLELHKTKQNLPKPDIIECALEVPHGTISDLLSATRANRLAVVACVDEARDTYPETSPTGGMWTELHSILQRFEACAFIADSTTVLPTLVRGNDPTRIHSLGYDKSRCSLNGDKMGIAPVSGLTTMEQYKAYAEHCNWGPTSDETIRQWHLRSAGRYRSIDAVRAASASNASFEDLTLPKIGELGYTLLGRMLNSIRQDKSPVMRDVFATQWFNSAQIMNWTTQYAKQNGKDVGPSDVLSLVERGVLRQRVDPNYMEPDYTFGSPYQLQLLLNSIPSVFVSFAWVNLSAVETMLGQFRDNSGFSVIVCTSPESQTTMAELGPEGFEKQAIGIRDFTRKPEAGDGDGDGSEPVTIVDEMNAFILLVLTKEYIARFESGSGGVFREVTLACQLAQSGHADRILMASLDSDGLELKAKLPKELSDACKFVYEVGSRSFVKALADKMTVAANNRNVESIVNAEGDSG